MEVLKKHLWNSVEIERRHADNYYNGTSMCRACGTRAIAEYLRTQRCMSYCNALATDLGLADSSELIQSSQGGNHSGTWVHPRVAIDLARWLCPQFAVHMDRWFIEEVLAASSKTQDADDAAKSGSSAASYAKRLRHHQLSILDETQLHYAVVAYIRKKYPNAIVLAGLGELQDSEERRIDAYCKGYTKGQPDIIVMARETGARLALELKHPGYEPPVASDAQAQVLRALKEAGCETLAL